MNKRMIFKVIGSICYTVALLLLIPAVVSLIYSEYNDFWCFIITAAFSAFLGLVLQLLFRPKNHTVFAKDGFIIVALAWIITSLIGAIPFTISGTIPSYVDAFFETVSGFTTTGASILTNVESVSHGMLFWRSFTHWIGGMGVLVFIVAVVPNFSDGSIHILRAEMPGPTMGKLLPKLKDMAKNLYIIYIVLTVLEIILLIVGGMSVFDSLVHSFGTAGTGGFGVKSDSIGGYSPYLQWVIAIFMMLFGINFNVYFLIVFGRIKSAFKSTELYAYLGIILLSTGVITVNTLSSYSNLSDNIRTSFFQVSSIITTTGFSTADFDAWPGLSKAVLLLLMFIGACAGSTGGGFKVSRLVLVIKQAGNELKRMLRPRSVKVLTLDGKQVEHQIVRNTNVYFTLYVICCATVFLLISFEPFGIETNFSAMAACFNNIGPGFGAVGPTLSFAKYTDFSKIVLSIAMLLGRLEIFPLLLTFSPTTWKKN